jgi:hypothetical protein
VLPQQYVSNIWVYFSMLGCDEAAMGNMCGGKTYPESKFIEIGGRCLLGSTSVLFEWGTGILLGLFYEYGKATHSGFGKGSIRGIEDCIGSDGIHTEN